MKKRTVLIGIVLLAAAGGGWYYYKNYYEKADSVQTQTAEGSVYMSQVSDIMDQGALGMSTRLVGVVDPQESKDIKLDSDKTVKEIFVSVGDQVKVGDALFSYDVEAMRQKLQEADLDLEEMNNTLQTMNQQLNELNTQAAKAKESEKQAYNLQILSAQNSIHKQEYNISVKQLERAQLEKNIDNAVVYADIEGVVKTINSSSSSSSSYDSSTSDAFMTILATGEYRIKGTCNEMNIYSLYVGEKMVIHPRADEEKTYTGEVTKIETEAATDTNTNNYSDSSGETTKYHFYVKIDNGMDLMLGQHVIMEEDTGDTKEKTGLWIPSYYVVQDEDSYYVWSCNDKKRVCKKEVSIGETDDEAMEYQIADGLTKDDYIAYPDELTQEGMEAVLPDSGVSAE